MKISFRNSIPTGTIKTKYYIDKKRNIFDYWIAEAETVIEMITDILDYYEKLNMKLTNRQLYYQMVAQYSIPNALETYKRICTILTDLRYSGVIDWDAIEDRLRQPDKPACWNNPAEIIDACINQYRCDRMKGQQTYIEVWVEKDALSGVLKRVTEKYGIPIIVNRGYSSATAMFDAHERFVEAYNKAALIKVIYVGDFDPSGQDMIRDITDRINEFNYSERDLIHRYDFQIKPIALLWSQIEVFNPPPNPAKITDPRAKEYIKKHGPTSWEVDALRPEVLNRILTEEIETSLNKAFYSTMLETEKKHKEQLMKLKLHLS